MSKSGFYFCTLLFVFYTGQSSVYSKEPDETSASAIMTNERLDSLIHNLDDKAEGNNGFWRLKISNLSITVITDQTANRMRIIIPVIEMKNIDNDRLHRLMQANFDSTLDARYAIAKNILWSAYIHPLESLSDEEFLNGLGQTVNLVTNYGGSYSSGLLTFGGGDRKSLQDKQLINELIDKGNAI